MYEFTRLEEPEPQASGRRFGPPRKHTAVGLLAWIIHDFAGGKRKGALKD
jgi:hypothetical protein